MKIGKIEHVSINVKNLDEAVKRFSDVLGTTFVDLDEEIVEKTVTEHADSAYDVAKVSGEGGKLKEAMDRTGNLTLVESDPPLEKEGLRSIFFKVPDIEQAKAEMKQKEVRLTATVKIGGVKEAMFSADDLHGVRLILREYQAPTLVDATPTK